MLCYAVAVVANMHTAGASRHTWMMVTAGQVTQPSKGSRDQRENSPGPLLEEKKERTTASDDRR